MALAGILSVSVRPDRMSTYEALVHRLADKARAGTESFEWAAHQVVVGEIGTIHFVTEAPSWAAFAAREPVDAFIRRIMGDTDGALMLDQLNECVAAERYVIGRDRLDLSHPPDEGSPRTVHALVTLFQVRRGGEDACEELIRKSAQAIPRVDDPRRFIAYQTVIGDARRYWIVTPLGDVGDLDRMLPPQELLLKAFGAEGALVYRTGLDAVERLERHLTMLRPELSNASWLGTVSGRAAARPAGMTAEATH